MGPSPIHPKGERAEAVRLPMHHGHDHSPIVVAMVLMMAEGGHSMAPCLGSSPMAGGQLRHAMVLIAEEGHPKDLPVGHDRRLPTEGWESGMLLFVGRAM